MVRIETHTILFYTEYKSQSNRQKLIEKLAIHFYTYYIPYMELLLYTIYTFLLAGLVSTVCGWQIGHQVGKRQPLATTTDAASLSAFYVNTLYIHMTLFPACLISTLFSNTNSEFGILFLYCTCSTLLLRSAIITIAKKFIQNRKNKNND